MEDIIRKIKAEIREIMTRYKCTYQEALCCLGKEKAAIIPNKHYMVTYHRKDKAAHVCGRQRSTGLDGR